MQSWTDGASVNKSFQHTLSDETFVFVQKEVVSALPKLIKLNPVVVKEVFNRLLGVQSECCFVSL